MHTTFTPETLLGKPKEQPVSHDASTCKKHEDVDEFGFKPALLCAFMLRPQSKAGGEKEDKRGEMDQHYTASWGLWAELVEGYNWDDRLIRKEITEAECESGKA